jgi:hypothetical protein
MEKIVYWKMRNGQLISVDDMDINHLRNTLKMILNNSKNHKPQKKVFELNGDMAEQFNYDQQICDATEIDLY